MNVSGDFGVDGAIYAHLDSSLYLEKSDFRKIFAEASGGAVAVEDSFLGVVLVKFIYNQAARSALVPSYTDIYLGNYSIAGPGSSISTGGGCYSGVDPELTWDAAI